MKKKLLALLLAATMVLQGTGILEVQAAITNTDKNTAVEMTLDTTYTVDLEMGKEACYKFTPVTDGVYVFESEGTDDVYGELYDSSGELLKENDDGGSNYQFSIKCILLAGETYYLKGYGYEHYPAELIVSVTLQDNAGWYVDYSYVQKVEYGKSRDLEVRVNSDNDVTYQWSYYNGSDYVEIQGATNNTYTVTGVKEMYKVYRCYVSDGTDSEECYIEARLDTGIELDNEYESFTIEYGNSKTLDVWATGGVGELSYQWWCYKGVINEEDPHEMLGEYSWRIDGATSSTYTLEGNTDLCPYYACVVTDGVSEVIYTVEMYLDSGLRVENNQIYVTYEYGVDNVLSVEAFTRAEELSYQWYTYDFFNGEREISGATESTYTIKKDKKAYSQYRCRVSDGINVDICVYYYISWNTGLDVKGGLNQYINIPEGVSKTLNVEATSRKDGFTYQWFHSDDGENYLKSNGFTKSSLQITAEEGESSKYKCQVSDSLDVIDVIYEINIVKCMKVSKNEDNPLTEKEMFFEISEIEGAQKISFANTNNSCAQKLILYDADINELVDMDSDSVTYVFEKDKTYYLYAYSEAVESQDDPVIIKRTNVEFCALPYSEVSSSVLYNSEHTMEVMAVYGEGTLSYQWYYSDDGQSGMIEGATQNEYTITADKNVHEEYYCKVRNENGNESDEIDVYFYVSVNTNLIALGMNLSKVKVPYAGTKIVTVEATSLAENITYQWYSFDAITQQSKAIEGATASSITLTGNDSLADAYYCVVSDGIEMIETNKVYTEIDTGLKAFTASDYFEGYYGSAVEFKVFASSARPNITYEWYCCNDEDISDDVIDWKKINGATSSVYSFVASVSSYKYFLCKVSDGILTEEVFFVAYYKIGINDINDGFKVDIEYTSVLEDGTPKEPKVTVKNDKKTLEIKRHYSVEYQDNVKPGTATIIIRGIGVYRGEITKTFTITAKPPKEPQKQEEPKQPAVTTPTVTSIANATVTLDKKSYIHDGRAKTPKVTVVVGGKTLVNGTDYTVAYANNKNIGTATVTITGKGSYNGTTTATFNINVKVGKVYTVGAYKYKVTSKSEVAFAGLKKASTKKVVIAGSVKIGGKKFKVTSIADKALQKKAKVTSVTVGVNIKKIGKNAFNGCKKLKTITVKSTKIKSVGKNALKGINSKAKLRVPAKKLKIYQKLFKGKGQGKKVSITK